MMGLYGIYTLNRMASDIDPGSDADKTATDNPIVYMSVCMSKRLHRIRFATVMGFQVFDLRLLIKPGYIQRAEVKHETS